MARKKKDAENNAKKVNNKPFQTKKCGAMVGVWEKITTFANLLCVYALCAACGGVNYLLTI